MRRIAAVPFSLTLFSLVLLSIGCSSPSPPRPPPRPGIVPERTLIEGGTTEVISSRRCGHLFFADVELNGHGPYPMILDTGTTSLIVTPEVDRELRADGGEERLVKTLRIGRLVVGELVYVPMELEGIEKAIGEPVAGILGMQVFRHIGLVYDYPGGEVRVEPLEWDETAPGVVPYEEGESGRPWLSFSLPPLRGRVLLDTGAGDALTLPFDVKVPGDGEPRPVGTRRLVPDRYTATAVRSEGIAEVGPLRFRNPIVTQGDGPARLGVPALTGFAMSFDQRTKLVRFTPSPMAPIESPPLRGIGVGMDLSTGRWEIVEVYAGTPAARAGLLAGDVITAVDGKITESIGCDRKSLLRRGVDRLRLTVDRGGRAIEVEVAIVDLVP